MVKFVITIQNKTFFTKKSLAERCKEILNSYKDGDRLNMFDEKFMIDFFSKLAKSHKLKGKKIVEVYVRKSKKYRKNLQFWIKREDGTKTDILSTPKPKAFNIKTKCIYKNFLLYYRTEGSFCIF